MRASQSFSGSPTSAPVDRLLLGKIAQQKDLCAALGNYIRLAEDRPPLNLRRLLFRVAQEIIAIGQQIKNSSLIVSPQIVNSNGWHEDPREWLVNQVCFLESNVGMRRPVFLFRLLRWAFMTGPVGLFNVRMRNTLLHWQYEKLVTPYARQPHVVAHGQVQELPKLPYVSFRGDIISRSWLELKKRWRDEWKGKNPNFFQRQRTRLRDWPLLIFLLQGWIYSRVAFTKEFRKKQRHTLYPFENRERLSSIFYVADVGNWSDYPYLSQQRQEITERVPRAVDAAYIAHSQAAGARENHRSAAAREIINRLVREVVQYGSKRIWILDPLLTLQAAPPAQSRRLCKKILDKAFPGHSRKQAERLFRKETGAEPSPEAIFLHYLGFEPARGDYEEFFEGLKKANPSQAHRYLAFMVLKHFAQTFVSLAPDPLLEKALAELAAIKPMTAGEHYKIIQARKMDNLDPSSALAPNAQTLLQWALRRSAGLVFLGASPVRDVRLKELLEEILKPEQGGDTPRSVLMFQEQRILDPVAALLRSSSQGDVYEQYLQMLPTTETDLIRTANFPEIMRMILGEVYRQTRQRT